MKKYLPEILVFSVVFAVLMLDLLPDITWMNTNSDGAHYILAAKYMYPAHNTSAPLFLLLGRLFLFLPVGTEAWRMGLISVLATTACAFVIYHIVKYHLSNNPHKRLYALTASVVYGGSALIISQSTIIETYALSTLLIVCAYYFSLKKRFLITSLFLGLTLAIHPLFCVGVWLVLLIANKEMRKVTPVLITLSFALFYLYLPITKMIHGDLGMWNNTSMGGFFGGNLDTMFMLVGGLSIYDIPKRLIDTSLILLVSMGLGVAVIIWLFIKQRTKKNVLMWLTVLPVLYFIINLSPETYVYMTPTIAFGAICVGIGLPMLNRTWLLATLVIAVGLWGYNTSYFDLGRTLDPEMSAMKFYHDLDMIPDGDKFMGGGWNWTMVFLYNKETGRDIIPISTDTFPSSQYLDMIEANGVKLERTHATEQITIIGEIGKSIARLNDGVWIAKETKPEVYQYEIVPAKENIDYIGRWIGQKVEPAFKFNPSNPYKFIAGELEVAEWHHILWVRYMGMGSILFFGILAIYGYGIPVIIYRLWKKRKNAPISVQEEKEN